MTDKTIDQIKIADGVCPEEDWLLVDDCPTFGKDAVYLHFDGIDVDIAEARVLYHDDALRLHGWLTRWLGQKGRDD